MVVHADDVPVERAPLGGERLRLGRAAGLVRTGLSRYRLAPGERAMPLHVHADEEELFYVVRGDGISVHDDRACAVAAGDLVVHRAGAEAHTLLAAPGGMGLDVLAFGSGSDTGLTWLPRARAWWAGPHWIPHDGPDPFTAEAAAGPLEVPELSTERPPTIAGEPDVAAERWGEGDVSIVVHDLATAAGSVRAGGQVMDVAPGMLSGPPHCHSVDEEAFVVLDGDGTLLLGDEDHAVRAGDVVARPAATGVPHAFRAGAGGLRLLGLSTREAADACFYPRSGKVSLRGLGVRFRVTQVEYWDGEREHT